MQDSELTELRQENSAFVEETLDDLKGMHVIISIVNSLTRHMHMFNRNTARQICVTASDSGDVLRCVAEGKRKIALHLFPCILVVFIFYIHF